MTDQLCCIGALWDGFCIVCGTCPDETHSCRCGRVPVNANARFREWNRWYWDKCNTEEALKNLGAGI